MRDVCGRSHYVSKSSDWTLKIYTFCSSEFYLERKDHTQILNSR